jgi:hypothetical protein
VVAMSDQYAYDFVTKRDTDTYGDIKDALHPQIKFPGAPPPLRRQLILADDDGFIFKDDTTISKKVMKLNVFVNNEIGDWNREERNMIDRIRDGNGSRGQSVSIFSIDTPGKIEAFLEGIRNNTMMKTLIVCNTNMTDDILRPIRHVKSLEKFAMIRCRKIDKDSLENLLHENRTINELTLGDDDEGDINPNETKEVFEIIGRNTTLHTLSISGYSYRMNDLLTCLRVNKSLTSVRISDCDVEIDRDLSDLSDILSKKLTFILFDNRISVGAEFIHSIRSSTFDDVDISTNKIDELVRYGK